MSDPISNCCHLFLLQFEEMLLALDLDTPDEHNYSSWNPSKPQDLKHPTVVSKTDFFEAGLPIEMGSFIWDSNLYMAGGKKVQKDLVRLAKICNQAMLDTYEGDGNQATNTDFYLCKRSNNNQLSVELTDTIPRMKAGKARPIVEEIGGKIFVHHSTGMFHNGFDIPDPIFEYYDPLVRKWEELPDVPYAKKKPNGFVDLPSYTGPGHFVIGSKLFIPSGLQDLYCYDVSTMRWDYSCSSNLLTSFREARFVRPSYSRRCVSGLGLDDDSHNVILCLEDFGCFKCPKPYGHLIDKTGRLLCSQDLSQQQQLFDDFLPYVLPTFESRFIDLGSGRVCAIMYGKDQNGIEVVLHICIFEIRKSPAAVDDIVRNPPSAPIKEEFLAVEVLNKYFCKLTGLVDYKFPSLVNAFIL